MKSKEIFLQACGEIAPKLPDFKAVQKGRILKKKSKNKAIEFKIYFDTSTKNYSGNIAIRPFISIVCKDLKKFTEEKGALESNLVFATNIGYLNARQTWQEYNLAGLSFIESINTITWQIKNDVFPIFELFENTDNAVDFLVENGTKFNSKMKDLSLSPFYFVWLYGGQEKAETFFNHFVKNCGYKGKFIKTFEELKTTPKQAIDVNHSAFIGEDILKVAYLNDIYLKL